MKKIRTLLITFKNEIPAHQVTAFRAAVIEKVGREHVVFHNHVGDDKYVYSYPTIQYKTLYNRPAIVCIEDGVEEIHKLFEQKNWEINVLGERIHLEVDRLELKTTSLNVWDKKFHYRMYRWQALNERNYQEYQNIENLTDRISMLEKILVGNILSFAKGVEWHIENPVEVKITDIEMERLSKMKDIKVATLNIKFTSNVYLPEYIGLGKGVSKGFGVVRWKRFNGFENKNNDE